MIAGLAQLVEQSPCKREVGGSSPSSGTSLRSYELWFSDLLIIKTMPLKQGDTLLIASNNQGKVKEIASLLSPYKINTISASEYDFAEPEENGVTFIENAQIKAEYYTERTDYKSLADDSGLVVPAINGQPGIYSARWGGPKKDFNLAINKIHDELIKNNIEPNGSAAYFICVLALAQPNAETIFFEGRVDGKLTFPAKGDNGFGYDPIFTPKGYKKTFAEMKLQEKEQKNHRADAFSKFVKHCFL